MRHSASAIIRRLTVATLLALTASTAADAQNDIQLTQYSALPSYYNPAATGTSDFLNLRAAGRMQWLGIENAPTSFLLTGDMPVKVGKKRIGVGLTLSTEGIGLFSNTAVNLQASYKLKFLKGELSIGVQGGMFMQKFSGTKVEIPDGDDYHQSTDEAIPTQDLGGKTIDLGAGVFYTHPKFYAGLSVLHALNPTVRMSIEGSESTQSQQYETELTRMIYFTAGSNIELKNTLFELQPSLLVKTDLAMFTAEATLQARYNKFLRFGAGYRWKDAVSILAGADIKDFYFGYSFDYPLSAIVKASSGSHEIVLGYRFKLDFKGKNKNRHRSIRLM